uniref:Uncharacterized protein n=1 Tax=Physcomitrium patens TaxID=3218 RepID=A0A7I3ZHM8_PHYPA
MRALVSVCVCEREREREREKADLLPCCGNYGVHRAIWVSSMELMVGMLAWALGQVGNSRVWSLWILLVLEFLVC